MAKKPITDQELDSLLALATRPIALSTGKAALMAKLGNSSATAQVIAFPGAKAKSQISLGWLAALPLAASLACGIYLGTMGIGNSYLSSAVAIEDGVSATGIDDTEALLEDTQS